ncbi:MAG: uroporphyrinogen-III synthase [Sphingomonadaceae bacterium]
MTGALVVLRPEPGLSATVDLAQEYGFAVTAVPMSEAQPVAWQAPQRDSFDALLLGSANALRHGGDALAGYRGCPALVVGEATARAARDAGLEVAATGTGGLQSVLDQIAGAPFSRLLRLAGEGRVALDPPAGVSMETRVVYRMRYLPLAGEALAAVRAGSIVLLHSGEAARHFAAECSRCAIDRSGVAIAALAPRIAEAAGPGWRRVAAPPLANDRALLELARDMCQ